MSNTRKEIEKINRKVIEAAGRGQTARKKLWAKEIRMLAVVAMLDLSEKCSRYAIIELPNSKIINEILKRIKITKIRLDELEAELKSSIGAK